jgi:phosphohistidine phosphatase
MKLYFLRHGIAQDHAPGLRDADRRLTPVGVDEMRGVGRGMAALDLRFDVILTSPLARARETAALAAEALGCPDAVREVRGLACGCGLDELATALAGQAHDARVLLVGHEPDFSELISLLIGGGAVRMKKASLAYVEAALLAPGACELRWLLNAAHLLRIGG